MSAEHGQHHKMVAEAWERTGGDNPLKGFGDFQGFFDSLPYRDRLVQFVSGGQIYLICIDERLTGSSELIPNVANYVRMAGEGILNPNAEADMRKAGVNGIIPHIECGAKALYAADKGPGSTDGIGLVAARTIADNVGIPIVQTIGPTGFRSRWHDARAVYYDGTGRFDWGRVDDFPIPGFIVSRGILSDSQYAQQEVAVAISIAQGSHGLGHRFTPASPLYLIGITDNKVGSVKMDVLMRELGQVADKHQAVVADRLLAA